MKTYWGVDVYSHIFLTSGQLEVSGLLHAPAALPPRKKSPYPLDRRLSGPQSQSGRRGKEKILDPNGTLTPTPRPSSP
jgi:hypothetical protein